MSDPVCGGCFHRCVLAEGQTGLCRARRCEGGRIVSLSYGRLTALALDPIEKKPLALFYPGTQILSAGSFGCNLRCPFCQNAAISGAGADDAAWEHTTPERLADLAAQLRPRGNLGLAFTSHEPMIGWEFVRDAARAAHARGLRTVVVTNGTSSPEALAAVLPFIDAFNIDLKGFTEDWYRRLGGDLGSVRDFIRAAAGAAHVELTTLIVPGENDGDDEMQALSAWVASVDPAMPLHVTRFFPRHRMQDRPPTPVARVLHLAAVARRQLKNVFPGNV